MSRRSNNNVRGPTSALTEFLRESGINPATIARRAATREQGQGQGQNATQNGEQSSNTNGEGEGDRRNDQAAGNDEEHADAATPSTPAPSTRRRKRGRAPSEADYASDQLDEVEEVPSGGKKRKTAARKAKATAAAKAKAKKKAKKDGEYKGGSSSDEEDEYNALSKNLWSMGSNGDHKPPVGNFENCARCEKQFTVTKYTLAANPPPGYLCHQCAKAFGADPFKKPAKSAKKRKEKREHIHFEERRFPTLASLCIELIGKHIDDVEVLGDIGSVNMDEIAKTLARNRSLTCENAQLFYDVQNTKLKFYDATNLTPSAFTTLASLNPNLTHLHLDYCGRLTCPVIAAFSTSLPRLTHLSLLGPFLVHSEAWIEFFKAKPELRSFRIIQSARFNRECANALAEFCTQLEDLQLKEVGLLDDSFVEPLCALPPLKSLDLSHPGIGIVEDGWLQILEKHGHTLESFNPSWHEGFTDLALEHGIRIHTRVLSELRLEGLLGLSDDGVARFFNNWNKKSVPLDSEDDDPDSPMAVDVDNANSDPSSAEPSDFIPNPPLRSLSLTRNYALSTATFVALLAHSARSLVSLDLNGLGLIAAESLAELKNIPNLCSLDMSWCRELDDFIMKDVVSSASKLAEVKVWGCTHVRGIGWAGKKGLKVDGIEPNAGT